jgi:peptidyl-prolyl cis-trans isomerase SurA
VVSGGDTVVIINGRAVSRDAYEDVLYERYAENHLEAFVEDELVRAKAKEMGIAEDSKEVDAEVDKSVGTLLKTRFGGSETALRNAMIQRNMTLEGWKKELRAKASRQNLIGQMIKSTRTAESPAVKKKFDQKYGEDGKKYRVRHILISTKVINSRFYPKSDYTAEKPGVENEAKELGKRLLVELTGGADFAVLAKEHSDDFTSNRGGSLGEAWKGRFGKAFDETVVRMAVGKVSGLIRGRRGFHVMEVTKVNRGLEYSGSAILVGTGATGPLDKRTPEERDAAGKTKVAQVQKALADGKDFAAVAKEFSDDVSTKSRGGDLGTFGRRRLGKEVDAALATAKVGALTDPIKSPRGYWIVKLDARKAVPKKDRRVVRHIFLSTEYDDVKKRRLGGKLEAMAEKKARDLMTKVEAGGDFKKLAAENTEDAYTRKAGGEYYNYRRTSLGSEVWEAVEKLEAGKGTSLVKSKRGFHVVQVIEKTETKFSEVREELLAEVSEVAVSPADARSFLEGLKAAAQIERKIVPDPMKPEDDPASKAGAPDAGAPEAGGEEK